MYQFASEAGIHGRATTSAGYVLKTILTTLAGLCWLVLCMLSTPAAAAVQVHLQDRIVSLDPATGYLRDPSAALTLQQVQQRDDFIPVGSLTRMNFGYTDDAVWLRIPLQALADQPSRWMVEMEYAYLDDIRLYVVRADGRVEEQRAGRSFPVMEWPHADRKPVFPLALAGGESVTLYLRGHNHAALALDVRLVSDQAFSLSDKQTLILLALYFGTLVALGLYNLLLYIPIRQPSFLLYSLFEFSFGLAASSMNGVAPLMIWPASAGSADFVVPVFFTLATALAVLFARSFLQMREVAPRWHNFLTLVAVCWGIMTLTTVLVPPTLGLKIMSATGVLTTLSLLAAGIAAMRYKVHGAGIFVTAWSMLLIGTSLLSLRNAGWIPSNFFTVYSMQIGSAMEMLLLSFALGARFNLLKQQKEKVQQELVDTLREHERILEARVARRTEELLETKAKLELMVTQDALTGILNRAGLRQYFLLARKRALRSGQPMAVMLIDLDGFKPVNDENGHEAGDILLQTIARRLAGEVRETDAVGRLGGDEFVLMLEACPREEIQLFAERMLARITEPVDIGKNRSVGVQASIGVFFAGPGNETLKSMLRNADEAMYRVKRSGKNGVAVQYGMTA